jgi:undecaprenyl-diphosphatase
VVLKSMNSDMDFHLFQIINHAAGQYGLLDRLMRAVATYGPALFVLPLAYLWFFEGEEGKKATLLALASLGLALLIAQIIVHVSFRERPPFAHPGEVRALIDISTDSSFPSDHATFSFAIAWVVWLKDRRLGWPALGLGALIAFSRVFVGTHYPLDVIGGAVIGLVSGLLVWNLRRQLDPITSRIVLVARKFRI